MPARIEDFPGEGTEKGNTLGLVDNSQLEVASIIEGGIGGGPWGLEIEKGQIQTG